MGERLPKANRSINSIDDLTDLEVLAVVQKLKEDPVMTEVLGIAWAIGMVTNRPLLLDDEESAPRLYARYKQLINFPLLVGAPPPAGED